MELKENAAKTNLGFETIMDLDNNNNGIETKEHDTKTCLGFEVIKDINLDLESAAEIATSNADVGNFNSDVDYGCCSILFCCFTIFM